MDSIQFSQAYLTNVFILATSTWYNFLTAALICGLLALKSVTNTNVLWSSIFFIADSVVNGYLIMAKWSNLKLILLLAFSFHLA